MAKAAEKVGAERKLDKKYNKAYTVGGKISTFGIITADRRLICPRCGRVQERISPKARIRELKRKCRNCTWDFWVNVDARK